MCVFGLSLPPSLCIFLGLRLKYILLLVNECRWGWDEEAGAVACSWLTDRAGGRCSGPRPRPMLLLLLGDHYFSAGPRRVMLRVELQISRRQISRNKEGAASGHCFQNKVRVTLKRNVIDLQNVYLSSYVLQFYHVMVPLQIRFSHIS